MAQEVTRKDIWFSSEGTDCAAWLYVSGTGKQPVIVMAHGLGSTRDMRLDAFASSFAEAGFACFLFDYRNNGDSKGDKRYRVNVKEQLEDWNNAVDFVKTLDNIDTDRLFLFGTSFSGGHVMTLSAKRNDIRGTIAQCPYTDTFASVFAVPAVTSLKLVLTLCADCVTRLFGHKIMVPLAGKPNERALMVAENYTYYLDLMAGNSKTFQNITPVETVLEFFKYRPGKYAKDIRTPIYYAVCAKDEVAPAKKTLEYAKQSPLGTIKLYDCGHFDIYGSPYFEEASADYINFFQSLTAQK